MNEYAAAGAFLSILGLVMLVAEPVSLFLQWAKDQRNDRDL